MIKKALNNALIKNNSYYGFPYLWKLKKNYFSPLLTNNLLLN